MHLKLIIIPFLFFYCNKSYSQNEEFNLDFEFRDGIYLGFDQLQANMPKYPLTPILNEYISNNLVDESIIKQLNKDEKGEKLKMKDLWVICINGTPMRVTSFSKVIRGTDPYSASNAPIKLMLVRFITLGKITSFRTSSENYIFKHNVFKSLKLNRKNLSLMISDNPKLYDKFKKDRKVKTLLFSYITEYNRNNPIYITED